MQTISSILCQLLHIGYHVNNQTAMVMASPWLLHSRTALAPDGRSHIHFCDTPTCWVVWHDKHRQLFSFTPLLSSLTCWGVYAISQKEAKSLFRTQKCIHESWGEKLNPWHAWIRLAGKLPLNLCSACLHQESGRETPSNNRASSINGTDDEKISHVSPEAAVLKSENERLKSAVEQR